MKGQISYIEPIFTLLLAGVLAGALAVILPGQVIQVTPDIDYKEFENKAIILADSLLGNKNLVYSEDGSYQRGIFDKEKLDSIEDGEVSIGVFYPGTFTNVVIKDAEKDFTWSCGIPQFNNFCLRDEKSEIVKGMMGCMSSEPDDPIGRCSRRYTSVLDAGLPIAIRYPDGNVHLGTLTVTVIE